MSELQEHIENCDCRLVACPNNCGGKFLQRGIPKHLATRCPNKSASPPSVTDVAAPSSGSSTASPSSAQSLSTAPLPSPQASAPAVASPPPSAPLSVPTQPSAIAPPPARAPAVTTSPPPKPSAPAECKFCDEEFPATEIDEHEDKCVGAAAWSPCCERTFEWPSGHELTPVRSLCVARCDWKPKRCQHCNMVIISRDLLRHESVCKTSAKACAHCSESVRRRQRRLR